MKFTKWQDNYSVGVKLLDADHKKLLVMIANFYDGIMNAHTESFGRLLTEVNDYAASHFGKEERYFDQYGYPYALLHKEAHKEYSEKMREVKKRFEAGKIVLSLEVTTFLKEWWITHINSMDKQYMRFFNEKGLK